MASAGGLRRDPAGGAAPARQTRLIAVDPRAPQGEGIAEAARVIRGGGLVAFPTETVYGLGANALDGAAVRRIFEAKGRPADNPLIVHVAAMEELRRLCGGALPEVALRLAEAFWPGPLTMVLPRGPEVPDETTAGLPTVAVRMPSHPVARALIAEAGVPIAAPSANRSGRPSPTTAQHVLEDLQGRVDLILDGGPAGIGVESTVVDPTESPPVLLRPGGVTPEMLERRIGPIRIDPMVLVPERGPAPTGDSPEPGPVEAGSLRPRSPGMKYTHYAPRAPLHLVEGPQKAAAQEIGRLISRELSAGRRVGALLFAEDREPVLRQVSLPHGSELVIEECGERSRPETVAAKLFDGLRRLDRQGVEVIVACGLEPRGVGLAVMNRLRKAASFRHRVSGEPAQAGPPEPSGPLQPPEPPAQPAPPGPAGPP